MNNLVIIGNGFDLAHGLKTSYVDFIKHIINSKYENNKLYNDLFEYFNCNYNYVELIASLKSDIVISNNITWNNKFFQQMALNTAHNNWCDIERLYFQELLSENYKNPKQLNEEFEVIKKYLEIYLDSEKDKFSLLASYKLLFNHLQKAENTFILNFNYTNTIRKYIESNPSLNSINIHGELNKNKNPIIFGFAADDAESRKLVQKDDKEFMRNIKKHCYKRTNNQDKLITYLEKTENIDVLIFGHSSGISDKLILNQIFNHKNIKTLRAFYFDNHEKYFETQVNIDRIMNNDSHFTKLINFDDSFKMPQHDDDVKINSHFENYILSLIESQKYKKKVFKYS
jgi:hypothetical protein